MYQFSVLNPPAFSDLNREFPSAASAAAAGDKQSLIDIADHFFFIVGTRREEGIGHTGSRRVSIILFASVAGRLHSKTASAHPVTEITFQDTIFNQHISSGRRTLIVHRFTAVHAGNRAVIQQCNLIRRDLFTQLSAEFT